MIAQVREMCAEVLRRGKKPTHIYISHEDWPKLVNEVSPGAIGGPPLTVMGLIPVFVEEYPAPKTTFFVVA